MAGTKRDYSQYLPSTRKVNIAELLAQSASHITAQQKRPNGYTPIDRAALQASFEGASAPQAPAPAHSSGADQPYHQVGAQSDPSRAASYAAAARSYHAAPHTAPWADEVPPPEPPPPYDQAGAYEQADSYDQAAPYPDFSDIPAPTWDDAVAPFNPYDYPEYGAPAPYPAQPPLGAPAPHQVAPHQVVPHQITPQSSGAGAAGVVMTPFDALLPQRTPRPSGGAPAHPQSAARAAGPRWEQPPRTKPVSAPLSAPVAPQPGAPQPIGAKSTGTAAAGAVMTPFGTPLPQGAQRPSGGAAAAKTQPACSDAVPPWGWDVGQQALSSSARAQPAAPQARGMAASGAVPPTFGGAAHHDQSVGGDDLPPWELPARSKLGTVAPESKSSAPTASFAAAAAVWPQVPPPSDWQAGSKPEPSFGASAVAQTPQAQPQTQVQPKKQRQVPTPASFDDDGFDFEAVLALPQLLYLDMVEHFRKQGNPDPEAAAVAFTTMHPEPNAPTASGAAPAPSDPVKSVKSVKSGALSEEYSFEPVGGVTQADLDAVAGSGWAGAARFKGNFEERMRALMAEIGVEVLAVEDRQYQKLCTLLADNKKFKLSVFYKVTGKISYVQTSGLGAKAQQALTVMQDFQGCNIRKLPESADELSAVKDELQKKSSSMNRGKGSARGSKRSLVGRNANLKLTSAEEAQQMVKVGKVDLEALAAAGKGELLTLPDRIELIVHDFDRALVVKQDQAGQYHQRFHITHPSGYEFWLRISFKQTQIISSVFLKLPEDGLCDIHLQLLDEIKQACAVSLLNTQLLLLIKPHSAKCNEEHVLTYTEVKY